ncbi:penicillin-binding transpeptidase domain-containing protein, partial [Salipiger bermudensis]
MVARVATGRSVEPRLVRSVGGLQTPSRGGTPLDIDEAHLKLIRKAMFVVSNSRRGTAYRSRIIAEDMRLAGKTGTSQVLNRVVRNQDVPWEERDHALFVNFAPYDAPRIAVSIVVEHGGGGSSTAAPIARDITLQALYKGTPPLEAYPVGDRERIQAQQERLEAERAKRAAEAGRRA